MAISASNLLNANLLKDFIKLNVNTDTIIKNMKLVEVNTKFKSAFLNAQTSKDDLVEYICLCCNKNYLKDIDQKLEIQHFNTDKVSNSDTNKYFIAII